MKLHAGSVDSYGEAAAELAVVDWSAVWCPFVDRADGGCPHEDRSSQIAAATGWEPVREDGAPTAFRTPSQLMVVVSGHSATPEVDRWRVAVSSQDDYHAACAQADLRWPALLSAVRVAWGEPSYTGFWLDDGFPGMQHPRRRRPRTRRAAVWIGPHCVLDLSIGDGGGGYSGFGSEWAITLAADARPGHPWLDSSRLDLSRRSRTRRVSAA